MRLAAPAGHHRQDDHRGAVGGLGRVQQVGDQGLSLGLVPAEHRYGHNFSTWVNSTSMAFISAT